VRTPSGRGVDGLADLDGRIDLVMIDAPCTGTGAWRRNPDAKWRIRPGALAERVKEQHAVLEQAATLAKPGGRIAYITCSILAEENGDQVQRFLSGHPEFSVEKPAEVVKVLGERAYLFAHAALVSDAGLLMTPRRTDTDGFFVSLLRRQQS
jgi:16S rRNA (cytosine967-C5)-methyltransferase